MTKSFGRRLDLPEVSSGPTVASQSSSSQPPAEPPVAREQKSPPRSMAVDRLREKVFEQVDPLAVAALAPRALQDQLERLVHEIGNSERIELSSEEQMRIAEELSHDMLGFGPLEPLLRDDSISDIMVNGLSNIFIEVRGKLRKIDLGFRDAAQLNSVAQKMAALAGRRVDESSPLLDCRLADGSRVNVVFPPLAIDGASISIRKFSEKKINLDVMVEFGTISPAIARALEIAARCRLNIIISGGTGSGKTTMMNALSRTISGDERIVTIEDAAELQLQQPHVVRLETRPPNLEGKGEVTQRDLIRNALRMRPDRIIVGEVRGAEAFDMLQAMNTGHDGSICTIHANTARDAVTRVENMVQMGIASLPPRAIRNQIASAVDLIVQVQRMRDGVRRVIQVTEVCGLEGEVITMNDIFSFEYLGEDSSGRIEGRWSTTGARPIFLERLEHYGMADAWMQALESARQ